MIDCDTHITEPPDVWTARLPAKFRDRAPVIVHDEKMGWDVWKIGEAQSLLTVGHTAVAGWPEPFPSAPRTLRGGAAGRVRREGPPRLHGLDRRVGDGALPERRRLRQRGVPAARRSRAHARVRAGLQRLPDRLDQPRPAPLHPDPGHAVLGSGRLRARDRAQRRARAPRRAVHGRAAEVRLPVARGPALGPALGRGAGHRTPDQLPHRQRQPHRGVHARDDADLRDGRAQREDHRRALPRERQAARRPAVLGRARALPEARGGVGRERDRLHPVHPRGGRLRVRVLEGAARAARSSR